jgi:X-X-X-Leu-X-X-Gly heptad repeat protein
MTAPSPFAFDPTGVLGQLSGRMVDPALLAEEARRQEEARQAQAAAQQSSGTDYGGLADGAEIAYHVGTAAVNDISKAVKDYIEPRTFNTQSDSVLGSGSGGWTSTPMDAAGAAPSETVATLADAAAGAGETAGGLAEAASGAAELASGVAEAVAGAVVEGIGGLIEGLFSWG